MRLAYLQIEKSTSHHLPAFSPFFLFFLFFLGFLKLQAQTGCPGCVTKISPLLAADTIYIDKIPDGEQGKAYENDLSFRLPKTTTPVAAIDSTIPPNLPISKFEIEAVENVPPGLKWEANQTIFQTSSQTDGCIKLCGTPTEADTFVILVKLKATVLFITQSQSFPLTMIVQPKTSTTDGFSLSQVEGCGEVTVNLTNNIPSGGKTGFWYDWNFGDSTTFSGENPPAHTFKTPGIYPIKYHAKIDTVGFVLKSFTVLSVGCVDQLGSGVPDLYYFVKNGNGTQIINPVTAINNTVLPHTFSLNLKLDATNFTLEVWDEDSGLKGGDDQCGAISFNYLSNDTIISGDFKAVLNIVHPVEEVFSTDTVRVFPVPIEPIVQFPAGLTACAGSDTIVLVSSYGSGNQWFMDGEKLIGQNDFAIQPKISGSYSVQVKNSFGCTAMSKSVDVKFLPVPILPQFWNNKNRQTVLDTTTLPANFALQWFMFDAPIPGENGFTYCVTQTGTFGLEVIDLSTGCKNFYETPVTFNPNFDCTVGTKNVVFGNLEIFPNPATDRATVLLNDYILPTTSGGGSKIQVSDFSGKILQTVEIQPGSKKIDLDCSHFPAGIFTVEIFGKNNFGFVGRLVVVK